MSEIRLKVEDMSCGHCVASITGAVEKVPGVTGIECALDTKIVTVSGDGVLDQAAVVSAIQGAGYSPQLVE